MNQQQQQQQHCSLLFSSPFFYTDIHFFHTIRHVCPAREAKPRFGSALVYSLLDCETRLVVVG